MSIYCFDTSAINELHDDPDRESIVKGLLATNRIYLTALNMIEACGTEDENRRSSLIAFQKRLTGNYRPLAIPNELLQTLAVAHATRDTQPIITINKQQDGIWIALNAPSEVDEQARQEVFGWKSQLEASFTETHRKAREAFQDLFENGKSPRPRTASALIRHYGRNEDFLYEVVGPLYQRSTGLELPRSSLRQFLSDVPPWLQYLLGWAHEVFRRGIRKMGYGAKKNPGAIDLWCAVYLCFCDFFVTHDHRQRRALRVLNVFNPRKTRIISFQDFRKRLLVGS